MEIDIDFIRAIFLFRHNEARPWWDVFQKWKGHIYIRDNIFSKLFFENIQSLTYYTDVEAYLTANLFD